MDVRAEFRRLAEGQPCLSLIAQRYWYAGQLEDEANVLFLQTGEDRWLRFFFDCGVFFVRVEEEPSLLDGVGEPLNFTAADLSARHGFEGRLVEAVEFEEVPGGGALRLRFAGGGTLVVRNADDRSTASFEPPVA